MHRFGTHRVAALRVSPPLLLRAYPGTQHDIALPLVQAREIFQSEQFRQMMFHRGKLTLLPNIILIIP